MPTYRRWKPAPPPEEPSLWERIGGLPGAAAAATRGITSVIAPGYIPGAIISGAGEALAQGFEAMGGIGLDQTIGQRLARIGVEAGTGSIPFAKLLKAGKFGTNLAKAGAVTAAGDIARQGAEQGTFLPDVDWRRTGTAAGIGGTAGATSQKVVDYFTGGAVPKPAPAPKAKTPDVVEQTARPGGQVLVPRGKPNKRGEYGSYERQDVGPDWSVNPNNTRTPIRRGEAPAAPAAPKPRAERPKVKSLSDLFYDQLAKETGETISSVPSRTTRAADKAADAATGVSDFKAPWEDVSGWDDVSQAGRGIPIRSEPGITPREQRTADDLARRVRAGEADEARRLKAQREADEAETAARRAEELKAQGAQRKDTLSERATRINEEGARETVTSRWEIPDPEDAGSGGVKASNLMGGGANPYEPGTRQAEIYRLARNEGFDHEGAINLVDNPPRGPKGLAVRPSADPRPGLPARFSQELGEDAGRVADDFVDADFEVVEQAALPESPLAGLLTGRVRKPRVPRAPGTQTPDMGPNWPPTADVIEQSAPRVVDELADLEEAAARRATSSYDPNWPSREDVVAQSSNFFDDELQMLEDAIDAAGTNYRVAKLGGQDPEIVKARGTELSELARRLGLPTKKPPTGQRFQKANPDPAPTPPATQEDLANAPDWVKEQLAEVERQANTVIPAGPLPAPELPAVAPPPVEGPALGSKLDELRRMLGMSEPGSKTAEALNELIAREMGGPVPPRPNIPPPDVPPTPPPPAAPVPRSPKGKGPKTPKAPAAPKVGAQQNLSLAQLLGGEGGGLAPSKATKGAGSNRVTAQIEAQRKLEEIEQAMAHVAPGSAEEASMMQAAAAALKDVQRLGPPPAPKAPTILSEGGGKPRLVKTPKNPINPTGERGIMMMGSGQENMIPLTMLTTALGGLTGAAINPDDPITSALIGASIGLGAPMVPTALSKADIPSLSEGFKDAFQSGRDKLGEVATETIEKIPNAMRANLLWGGNLPINVAAAPYGSAAIAGLEESLVGNPAGREILRNLNPVKFAKGIWENKEEAAELLAKGEMGRLDADATLNPTRSMADVYMAGPALGMASGDVTGRNVMTRSGLTEEMARRYALTGEPVPEEGVGGFIGHTINTIGRGAADTPGAKIGKAAIGVAQPFRRTMANVISEGLERLPGVGAGIHIANKGLDNVDWQRVMAQQALSVPISALAGLAGSQIDPETAKMLRLRSLISNMSGVYSLPASLAYTIGMGLNEGQSPKQLVRAGVSEMLPLPSTAPFEDALKAGIDLYGGETPEIPRQMYPGIVRDVRQLMGLNEPTPRATRRIPRMNRNRRRE